MPPSRPRASTQLASMAPSRPSARDTPAEGPLRGRLACPRHAPGPATRRPPRASSAPPSRSDARDLLTAGRSVVRRRDVDVVWTLRQGDVPSISLLSRHGDDIDFAAGLAWRQCDGSSISPPSRHGESDGPSLAVCRAHHVDVTQARTPLAIGAPHAVN